VLETAPNTADAVALLERIPVSMSYNVTLLDRKADAATLFLAPDRPPELTRRFATTNFQHRVDWPEHARATHSVERLRCLEQRLTTAGSTEEFANALLQPPLFQSSYLRGYGTLYTAVYLPRSGRAELRWPGVRWAQSLQAFTAGRRDIVYAPGTKS
jgi:predicted choloylglycine hydrolase